MGKERRGVACRNQACSRGEHTGPCDERAIAPLDIPHSTDDFERERLEEPVRVAAPSTPTAIALLQRVRCMLNLADTASIEAELQRVLVKAQRYDELRTAHTQMTHLLTARVP